jgi:hypothetical protein
VKSQDTGAEAEHLCGIVLFIDDLLVRWKRHLRFPKGPNVLESESLASKERMRSFDRSKSGVVVVIVSKKAVFGFGSRTELRYASPKASPCPSSPLRSAGRVVGKTQYLRMCQSLLVIDLLARKRRDVVTLMRISLVLANL